LGDQRKQNNGAGKSEITILVNGGRKEIKKNGRKEEKCFVAGKKGNINLGEKKERENGCKYRRK